MLVVLIGLVVLLPTIASSDWAKTAVLKRINAQAPGDVSIADWDLGWSGGLSISGISYSQPDGLTATVPSITIERGLWDIATAQEAGAVTIHNPVVCLPASLLNPVPVQPKKHRDNGNFDEGKTAKSKPTPKAEPFSLALPATLTLQIRNGEVLIDDKPLLHAITLDLPLVDPGARIPLTVSAKQPGNGTLKLDASADPAHPGALQPAEWPLDADLSLDQINLEELLAPLAAIAAFPTGKGQLSGTVTLSQTAGEPLHAQTNLRAADVLLTGGPLKTDQLLLATAGIDANIVLSDPPLIHSSQISLPFATLSASGTPERVEIQGQITLAPLASALPATLGLQKGMTVEGGTLRFRATLEEKPEQRLGLDASLRLDGLAGTLGDQAIAWNQPVILVVDGVFGADHLELSRLQANASFLQISGKGTLEDFEASAQIDLTKGLKEIGAFVDLGGWQADGNIDLTVRITPGNDQPQDLSASIAFAKLSVSDNGLPLITEQDIGWTITGSGDLAKHQLAQLDIAHTSALATGELVLTDLVGAIDDTPATFGRLKANGRYDLAKLNPFLHHFAGLPAEIHVDGQLSLQAAAARKGTATELSALRIAVKDATVETPDSIISDPQWVIQLDGPLLIDPETRKLPPTALSLSGAFGSVAISGLQTEDWAAAMDTLQGQVKATFNLEPGLGGIRSKQADTDKPSPTWSGDVTASALIRGAPDGAWQTRLNLVGKDVKQIVEGKVALNEPAPSIQAAVQQTGEGHLVLNGLQLDTSLIDLSGKAQVLKGSGVASNRFVRLTASGDWTPDLDAVGKWIRTSAQQELVLTGKHKEPFSLDLPLDTQASATDAGGPWGLLRGATLSASLKADKVSYLGLHATDLVIPVSISNETAAAQIRAAVNGGKVRVSPTIDMRATRQGRPPVLALPDGERTLDGVELTDELADALLASISPMFKGSSVADGTVNLVVDQFALPLDADWKPRTTFTGNVELRGVKLAASGLVDGLMELGKISERAVDIGDHDLGFECRNGRIYSDPLTFTVKNQPLSLAGSVGLDQGLNYHATIPFTADLVGKEVAKYTNGMQLKIPIGGTLSNPRIDTSAFRSAIKAAATQAATAAVENKLADKLQDKLRKELGKKSTDENGKEQSIEDQLEEKANELLNKLFR